MKSRFDFEKIKENITILHDSVSNDNFMVILSRLKKHALKLFVKNHFVAGNNHLNRVINIKDQGKKNNFLKFKIYILIDNYKKKIILISNYYYLLITGNTANRQKS